LDRNVLRAQMEVGMLRVEARWRPYAAEREERTCVMRAGRAPVLDASMRAWRLEPVCERGEM
jgi:hypothetical protein